jgi:hypothetical protein
MKFQIRSYASLATASVFTFGALLVPGSAHARTVSKTAAAGAYSVTLKVLPAESFRGPKAEMVRDGGAAPDTLKGSEHPNHHLVVFVAKDGQPVESATVSISYRRLSPKKDAWSTLPVVCMHVAGHGLKTAHYGNNVRLAPGSYEVQVTVDGEGPATFRFSLSG